VGTQIVDAVGAKISSLAICRHPMAA